MLRAKLLDKLPVSLRFLEDEVRRGGTGTLRYLKFRYHRVGEKYEPQYPAGVFVSRRRRLDRQEKFLAAVRAVRGKAQTHRNF